MADAETQKLMAEVAGVLTTILEFGSAPENIVYLALGTDIRRFEVIRELLLKRELVVVKDHVWTLTPEGTEVAKKCDEATKKILEKKEP